MKRLPYAVPLAALGAVFAMTLAASPAQADGYTCPMWRCGFNGVSENGIAFNGLTLNGLTLNGLTLNGFRMNGLTLNGRTFNGVSSNGPSETAKQGEIVPCEDRAGAVCKPRIVTVTLASGQRVSVD